MKKIKVAFIYRSSNPYMSKKAWATTYYHFFMDALKRNEELDVSYFPAEKSFDTSVLKINLILFCYGKITHGGLPMS